MDGTFLDGIRLAEQEVNEAGGVAGTPIRIEAADDGGDSGLAVSLLDEAIGRGPVAALSIGPGSVVGSLRPRIEEARVPVVLLGGDLYTARALFRYVFQAGVPVVWQARVLARYFVVDRGYARIALVAERGPEEALVREAFDAEMIEEGRVVAARARVVRGGSLDRVLDLAARVDAIAFFGSPEEASRVAEALRALSDPPQLAASSEALTREFTASSPSPGSVVPYPYTWAGWAEPIPRVSAFRERFRDAFGRLPEGFEQEGYDAVRVLADALERTRGRGGDRLVRVLESFRGPNKPLYSALPARLGPDDHTLIDEVQVGLFAVASAGDTEAWEKAGPWRPIMRTFTFDGRRTSLIDRDKRLFFPFWVKPRPSPKFFRSRYGITTRYGEDPLH